MLTEVLNPYYSKTRTAYPKFPKLDLTSDAEYAANLVNVNM